MAIIFHLWAECKDEEGILRFASHFTGLTHMLLNGKEITWTVHLENPCTDTAAVTVSSKDLSPYGVRTVQDALETTEAGLRLYHHLKTAPEFRFARIDWEAEIIPMVDLPDFVETGADGSRRLNLDCVVDEQLYRRLGSPLFFHPFREGYWWHRYGGEYYRPLYSNDQVALNELCRQLLPEYFEY